MKHRRAATGLNGITPQPTVNFIGTSVRSSYLTDAASITCLYDLQLLRFPETKRLQPYPDTCFILGTEDSVGFIVRD